VKERVDRRKRLPHRLAESIPEELTEKSSQDERRASAEMREELDGDDHQKSQKASISSGVKSHTALWGETGSVWKNSGSRSWMLVMPAARLKPRSVLSTVLPRETTSSPVSSAPNLARAVR